MVPERKSSGSGNSDMSKRSPKLFPLSDKVYIYMRQNIVYVGFNTILGCKHLLASWNTSLTDRELGGLLYVKALSAS